MRLQIFKAIAQRLREAVPEVKFISVWNEQLATIQTGKAWPLPAVFVEFDAHSWRSVGMGLREADIPVILHIVTRAADFNGSADVRRMDKALAYLDTIDSIDAALEGLSGPNFSSFMLTQSFPNHSHAELVENIEQFVTRARCTASARKVKSIEAALVLSAQYDKKSDPHP